MKKIFLVVAALGMLATSCTKDDAAVAGTESLVSFTIDSPELQTRYGEGEEATVLHYAFYNEDGILEAISATTDEKAVALVGGKAKINVSLVEGRKYSAIFWASAPDAAEVYDVDWTAKTVEMATNLTANDESYDAFYNYTINIDPARKTHRIELRRPFAQINIATADKTAASSAGFNAAATKVTVNAYKKLQFAVKEIEGVNTPVAEVAGEMVPFTYGWAANATGTATVGGKDYDMLSMNYVLVDARTLVNVKMEVSEDATNFTAPITREYTTVPVQRNYKTFIVGNLLTTNNEFIVETNPEWERPNIELSVWDGSVDTTWYNDTDTEFTLTDSQDLAGLAKLVDEGNTFEGKTVKLNIDMNLYKINENGEPICFEPIGSYRFDKIFKGTFDGQGHTISNLNQNTWALDNGYYYHDCGIGLFGAVQEATIKNLKMDNASISGESGLCGVVAAVAENVTFENITVSNSKCADYQYYAGGIVGWVSGDNNEFKNCNIEASTTIAAQWGDFDNSVGGVIGGAGSSAKIHMKDCTVACRIDAYSDVTSTYQWYAYRRCGMLIGNSGKTKVVNGTTYADAPQLTCENVTVIYGEWANYTYCEFAGTSWPYVRVQAGVSNSAYSNPRYGHPTDANGNTVVDDNHVHNAGEDHHICITFDQLYGGGQGVYGTRTHEGVTIDYQNQKWVDSASDLQAAIANKQNVKLAADVDMGTTQLALDNVKLDLNGKTLTTANNWGGMALKNGASIKNGTINHTGNTAAIKAFNVGAIENVTINTTCATADKTVTAIAVQQGGHVGTIKDVVINGVSQGIEVGYQATVDLIDNANVTMQTNGTANGIGLVINGGKVGKAVNSTFKGEKYGVTMHLKGVFDVNLELENCDIEGTDASIYAWDEKGISNTSGSLTLTYDATTTLTGPFVWDFEDECKDVISLNQPQ